MSRSKLPIKIRFPDARLTGIEGVFDLIRTEPDWRPDPMTKETLMALGIAKGKELNTLYALKFLGLVGDNGSPTKEFDALQQNFQPTLERLVRTSYAPLFQTIPLSRANQASLVRFFRTYGYSEETAEYQAKLFICLCLDAEIELPVAEAEFKRARFRKKG